ncbi:fibronectin-like [Sardina pilchardus]|uniref:fibronectin-like n=1 Tax=Sardina pilchardus TaxID=27697 RepID=UPI002E150566
MAIVYIKLEDGEMSEPARQLVHTAVPAPEKLTGVSMSPTSVHLTWLPPHGMHQTPHSYLISYHSGGTETQTLSTDSCCAVITGLNPCTNYSVSVCTKVMGDEMSEAVRTEVRTAVAAPKHLTVVSVTPTSVHLTWAPPHGMDQTPYSYQISRGTEPLTISKYSCSADIRGLNPYTNYSVSICTKVTDDEMSEAVRTEVRTAVPGPEQVTVVSVTPTFAELKWNPPHGIDQTPESYQISYHKGGSELKTISANSCCSNITGLKPCTIYTVSIRVKLKDGGMSEAVGTVVNTGTPVPQKLKVASVTQTSARLTWNPPHGMDQTPHSYQISYHSERTESKTTSEYSCIADITGLKPCTDYVVRVCTKPNDKDWKMSEAVEIKVPTTIPAPEQLIVDSVTAISAELTWLPPHGMDQTPHSYQISCRRKGADPLTISIDLCSAVITSLLPDTDYIISVCAKHKDERMSELVKKKIHTASLGGFFSRR